MLLLIPPENKQTNKPHDPWMETSTSHTVLRSRYLRPRSGEAHGQQHVQAGAAFDGARPVLSEPPREDFTVDVLLGSHGPLCGLLPAPMPSAGEREAPASP